MRAVCVSLKLNFSNEKLCPSLVNFNFFINEDSHEVWESTDLEKLLCLMQTIFPIPFKVLYISLKYV